MKSLIVSAAWMTAWYTTFAILLYCSILKELSWAYNVLLVLGCVRTAILLLCSAIISGLLVLYFLFLTFKVPFKKNSISKPSHWALINICTILDFAIIMIMASQGWFLLCGIWFCSTVLVWTLKILSMAAYGIASTSTDETVKDHES